MTDKINNGGPAFPVTFEGGKNNGEAPYFAAGMSLRAYIAAQALNQAVLDYGQPNLGSTAGQRCDRGSPVLPYATKAIGSREEIIAMQAVKYADALIAELAKGGAQ